MDLKQIPILLLCLVSVWSCMHHSDQCCDEEQLIQRVQRKLKNRFPQPLDPPAADASPGPAKCPLELYQTLPAPAELNARSVSPWRYVNVNLTDHFPSTYVEAQCLCTGCILFQDNKVVESHDYNSATVTQTRIFLKRVRCPSGKGYKLEPVSVEVPVGCTCVRTNT
ncbi:interleukin-17C [Melanotaenia boesemani]|uniref:interleukin-17C n=1 Tax=Melanotaenia boesemani TaxID=1250792 RepID=UPI001C05E8BC|nr:interleukin-17C [Melanotaenia boesemani]